MNSRSFALSTDGKIQMGLNTHVLSRPDGAYSWSLSEKKRNFLTYFVDMEFSLFQARPGHVV